MATALAEIDIRRARDMAGRGWQIWLRRGLLGLLCVVPVLALFNVFGQQPSTRVVRGNGAQLQLMTPDALRGGLLYEARFTITAQRDLTNAVLELGDGWAKGMTINTVEPSPTDETSVNGRLAFTLGAISAGDSFVLHLEFQVNPTTVGSRNQTVALYDGNVQLLKTDVHLRVWP